MDQLEEADPLVAALVDLTDLLVAEETLDATLLRVGSLACHAIGGCDYASVTFMREGLPYTIGASDPIADALDDAQYSSKSGPCLDAFRDRQVTAVPAIAAAPGWERFREAAAARGVQSSLSLPMVVRETSVGVLNLYSTEADSFSDVAREPALLFAAQAAAAVWNARLSEQTRAMVANLETALETRDLIGMAKGVIMVNEKVTGDEAFAILRTASQHRNVKLREVAVEVTETGVTPVVAPGGPAGLRRLPLRREGI